MMNRLDYLIDYLLKEDPQYYEMEIPSDLQGKRDLFRALRNVRWPKPISEEFLRLQDEELQAQLQEKGVVELNVCRDAINRVSTDKQLLVWQGDITRLKVDAIVNAAKPDVGLLPSFTQMHRQCDSFRCRRTTARGMLSIDAPTRSRGVDGAGQNHQGLQSALQVCHPHGWAYHPQRHSNRVPKGTISLMLPFHHGMCR